jgi:transcription initiation factor TFIIIB Brf1 subunit/transcription initiation factor TFIIB
MNIQEIHECPDCASPNIVHNQDREQIICRECGLIYEPLSPSQAERAKPKAKTTKKVKPKRK